jgi:hypothetical protein
MESIIDLVHEGAAWVKILLVEYEKFCLLKFDHATNIALVAFIIFAATTNFAREKAQVKQRQYY